jgi:hypothetical protein
VWWWKEANTTKWLFRKFVVIELHQCLSDLLVSRKSWWYLDEIEDETDKRDNESYLCTVGIWNYHCTIEISLHLAAWTLFIRNAGSLRKCLVLSQILLVSHFIHFVSPLCSVQFAFHKACTKTFSVILKLWWYFQRTLMKAMLVSLVVSMSYSFGERFKTNGIQWEMTEESGVAPFKGTDDWLDGERHNSYQWKCKLLFHNRVW